MSTTTATRRRRRGVVLATGLALTLLAAACGSDKKAGPTTQAPGTTTATTTPAGSTPVTTPAGGSSATTTPVSLDPAKIKNGQGATDTEIKVGVAMDLSGPFAVFGKDILATMQAKFDFVNDNGGIAGRKIKVVQFDTKSDAALNLQGFKKLWEQDKVAVIYTLDAVGPPFDYVQKNNIPVHLLGGINDAYSSKYPSVIPAGSLNPTWEMQAAYAVTHFLDVHPKVVAVSYPPTAKPLLGFIEDTWKTLGATKVLFEPTLDPGAACDALVLKLKDAGVEYWDQNGSDFLSCVPAELTLGWSPPLGQGGQGASSLPQAMLIGKPMADLHVIAGSPNLRADGSPRYAAPTPKTLEYVSSVKKYAPDFAKTKDLNDFAATAGYMAGNWIVDMLTGGAQKDGELSPTALLDYAHTVQNWDPGLSDPVVSMAPNCKTGNDATIWGQWVWDDATKQLSIKYFAPKPGEHMVTTSDFLKVDKCYLTELADKNTA